MILVTGITGKSGKWFLKRIVKESNTPSFPINNHQFRVVVRNTSDTSLIDNSPLAIEKVYGDLNDTDFLKSIMSNVSVILHIAGIHTSLNVVRAAVESSHIRWLILVHTTGIYSKYKSASKEYLSIEKEIGFILEKRNIKLTVLRPTMIYGSISDKNIAIFIKMVDKLRLFPVVNNARYLLQPVHEKDLGDAYYQILINEEKTANKNYNLSGKEPVLLIDIFKVIGKYLGKTNTFISIPFPLAYMSAWLLFIFTLGRIDFREKVQRLVEDRVFAHDDASRDFNYSPIGFDDGVRDEIREYLNRQ
jgi:uncharacterized protein YbjT (DUF2867 family)